MTIFTKRTALAFGAGLLALGVTAGVRASVQNTNQDSGSFRSGGSGRSHRFAGRFGGPGNFRGPGGPLHMLRMLGAALDLTDAQKEQIRKIGEAHREEWKALGDRARTAHDALNDAVMAATVDEGLIRSKAAEVATVDADMAVASARVHAEAWQVLTPEQQAKAKQLRAERRGRRAR